MHGTFWSPGKTTDVLKPSRSGMTFKPLTDDLGEAVLMSYLEAFPVRTFPVQERERESKENEAPCGNTWRELSVKFDLATHSWKTHQCLWEEDLPLSSLILPKWGMMRSGVLWERITPPPLTSETEYGSSESWATPTTMDKLPPKSAAALHKEATQARPGRSKPANLRDQVSNSHMWPTPKAHEPGMTAKTTGRGVEKSTHLTTQVALAEGMIDRKTGRLWPTPNQRDWKDTGATQGNRKSPNLGTMVHQRGCLAPAVMIGGATSTECTPENAPVLKSTNGTVIHTQIATPQARDFRTGQQSRWPTPRQADYKGATSLSECTARRVANGQANLPEAVVESSENGGQLNPTWVEWLMGWPLGWTDCGASATDKFRQWLNSHGI